MRSSLFLRCARRHRGAKQYRQHPQRSTSHRAPAWATSPQDGAPVAGNPTPNRISPPPNVSLSDRAEALLAEGLVSGPPDEDPINSVYECENTIVAFHRTCAMLRETGLHAAVPDLALALLTQAAELFARLLTASDAIVFRVCVAKNFEYFNAVFALLDACESWELAAHDGHLSLGIFTNASCPHLELRTDGWGRVLPPVFVPRSAAEGAGISTSAGSAIPSDRAGAARLVGLLFRMIAWGGDRVAGSAIRLHLAARVVGIFTRGDVDTSLGALALSCMGGLLCGIGDPNAAHTRAHVNDLCAVLSCTHGDAAALAPLMPALGAAATRSQVAAAVEGTPSAHQDRASASDPHPLSSSETHILRSQVGALGRVLLKGERGAGDRGLYEGYLLQRLVCDQSLGKTQTPSADAIVATHHTSAFRALFVLLEADGAGAAATPSCAAEAMSPSKALQSPAQWQAALVRAIAMRLMLEAHRTPATLRLSARATLEALVPAAVPRALAPTCVLRDLPTLEVLRQLKALLSIEPRSVTAP